MTRGFFAIGIEHPKTSVNVGTLWRSAAIFDAAFLFTIGRRFPRQASDTLKSWRHTPMFEFQSVDDLVDHLPHSTPLVGVEIDDRAKSLAGFHHPERACYLLGAEDGGLKHQTRERCHALVQIPTPRPFCLNVATAGSLLLYDRVSQTA
jgi:tRNA G18 (ribose-2'-O)-methylase SpoU